MNVLLSVLASALLMFVIWQGVDARVVLLFVAAICLAEMFILFRWRLSLPCPYCGFDPVLYKKSAKKCAQKVKTHLENKKDAPEILLHAKNPFQHLKPVKKTRLYQAAPKTAHEMLAAMDSSPALRSKKASPALRGE